MSRYVLRRQQVIPAALDDVFAFFEDPYNLEVITPPWLRFEIVRASDDRVRVGTLIDYRLSWQRLPMRWRTRIAEYRQGSFFADEMVKGPYRRWYHRHTFRELAGGVEMTDEVEYILPFGPLGSLVHGLVIRRQLDAIFDYRRKAVERIFAADPAGRTT